MIGCKKQVGEQICEEAEEGYIISFDFTKLFKIVEKCIKQEVKLGKCEQCNSMHYPSQDPTKCGELDGATNCCVEGAAEDYCETYYDENNCTMCVDNYYTLMDPVSGNSECVESDVENCNKIRNISGDIQCIECKSGTNDQAEE